MTEFCTSDYSDYDLSNECIEEELPEPLINTVDEQINTSVDEQNDENLNEPIKEPVDEPISMRKQITKDDVIKELIRVYSNNALITGNEKWIGDSKNDTELKNKLMSEIDRLTHEKNIKDDNCILNFEHISFFINSYKDDNIDEKYILFYSYCGIYDTYVATNHLNIKLAERYQLIPDVKEYIDGMIFVLERFIRINYPDKYFSFEIKPTLNADTKHSGKTFNDNFEYYINDNQGLRPEHYAPCIKERQGYLPTGPNNEAYQVKLELKFSPYLNSCNSSLNSHQFGHHYRKKLLLKKSHQYITLNQLIYIVLMLS